MYVPSHTPSFFVNFTHPPPRPAADETPVIESLEPVEAEEAADGGVSDDDTASVKSVKSVQSVKSDKSAVATTWVYFEGLYDVVFVTTIILFLPLPSNLWSVHVSPSPQTFDLCMSPPPLKPLICACLPWFPQYSFDFALFHNVIFPPQIFIL